MSFYKVISFRLRHCHTNMKNLTSDKLEKELTAATANTTHDDATESFSLKTVAKLAAKCHVAYTSEH